MKCNLCPRKCNIDRKKSYGACQMIDKICVAKIMMHKWEEPFISGIEYGGVGTGAIFFYGCNLNCVYCQNYKISNLYKKNMIKNNKLSDTRRLDKMIDAKNNNKSYDIYTPSKLANVMIDLQKEGAFTISLITGTIYIDKIKDAIIIAKKKGLKIPIVYNTSGYEDVSSLRLLDGLIDIYLPDFKYFDNRYGELYSGVKNYVDITKDAIKEMYKQVGKCRYDKNGVLKKGVIVRHLVLPGAKTQAKNVIKYLYDTYGDNIYLSIMNQYTPTKNILFGDKSFYSLKRRVGKKGYEEIINYMISLGVNNAFSQEGVTSIESYIPDFQ